MSNVCLNIPLTSLLMLFNNRWTTCQFCFLFVFLLKNLHTKYNIHTHVTSKQFTSFKGFRESCHSFGSTAKYSFHLPYCVHSPFIGLLFKLFLWLWLWQRNLTWKRERESLNELLFFSLPLYFFYLKAYFCVLCTYMYLCIYDGMVP